jgi:7,8-dihydropterin-6-yl-methyl-4-(beta-D-ribofuranosyl)aminobenzene 5'-phosphate synthase
VKARESIPVAENMLLRTGEIPRETDFEKGFKGHQMEVDGSWVDDTTVIDDNCIIARVKNRGLVVMTGCAHSGVVNSIHEAQRLTGERKVLAVIGGIHLMGASPEKIKKTVNGLMALEGTEVMACGHCTGWSAQRHLAEIAGDLYVHPNVGTKFKFSS